MKTSNILVAAAFIVAFILLILQDKALLAAYRSNTFRDPLKDFMEVNFKDFDAIDINAAGVANAKIVQGPFKIMVRKAERRFVQISKNGRQLQVDAAFKTNRVFHDRYYEGFRVYISCPSLRELRMDNHYIANDKQVTYAQSGETWSRRNILSGFTCDSLQIIQDNGSMLVLDSNNIGVFHATLGNSKGSESILNIGATNKIKVADIMAHNKSLLKIEAAIPGLNYKLDDSCRIRLEGAAARK